MSTRDNLVVLPAGMCDTVTPPLAGLTLAALARPKGYPSRSFAATAVATGAVTVRRAW